MMDRNTILGLWDQLRQRHGIALRVLEGMPGARIHEHPIPGMRSAAEIATHVYSMMKEIPEGVVRGGIRDYGEGIVPVADTAALLRHAHDCYAAGAAATQAVTEAQLAAIVTTPWGTSFPGWVCYGILNDEFLHHRGQLYVFARALGAAPPMMWDFAHNAPEFRPRG